ncbi:MAG: PAS domain S-box protein [Nitrospirota bacterium]|nr:PAS domain S-box protein [Nitrospirota bacterium]
MLTRLGSLYAKVLAGMSGLILLMGVVLIVFVETVVQERLHASLHRRGSYIAQEVASESTDPLLTDRHVAVDMLLRDIQEMDKDIAYVFIQDPLGKVIIHTFGKAFPSDLRTLGVIVKGGPLRMEHLETETGPILDFAAPIMEGSLGTVHVGVFEASLRREVTGIVMKLLLIIALVMIIGTGIAMVVARAVTRPVHALVRAIREVAAGNLDVAVDVRGADEVGVLAASFCDMLAKQRESTEALQVSEKKLRDIAASLGEGVLVMDSRGMLTYMNPEAENLLGWKADELFGKDAHDYLHAHHGDGSLNEKDRCPSTMVLVSGIRQVVERDMFLCKDGSFLPVSYVTAPIREGKRVVGAVIAFQDITMRQLVEEERERLIEELKDALENVKTLRGLIPICSSCKRIRDDKGYWSQIEAYVHKHSDAEFSHSICPQCAVKLYPQYYKPEGHDSAGPEEEKP